MWQEICTYPYPQCWFCISVSTHLHRPCDRVPPITCNTRSKFSQAPVFVPYTDELLILVPWHICFFQGLWICSEVLSACLFIALLWVRTEVELNKWIPKTRVVQTLAMIPLSLAHVIALIIVTDGKLGVKQLSRDCTCASGNIPSQGPWVVVVVKWFQVDGVNMIQICTCISSLYPFNAV